MSSRPHQATMTLVCESERLARTVELSLREEIGEIDDDRSATRLDREGRQVALTVDADDLVALRAAANTWLSLADVAERVAEIAGTWAK